MRLVGFVKQDSTEFYEKFDETIFNYAFRMKTIIDFLKSAGFSKIETYSSLGLDKKLKV